MCLGVLFNKFSRFTPLYNTHIVPSTPIFFIEISSVLLPLQDTDVDAPPGELPDNFIFRPSKPPKVQPAIVGGYYMKGSVQLVLRRNLLTYLIKVSQILHLHILQLVVQ